MLTKDVTAFETDNQPMHPLPRSTSHRMKTCGLVSFSLLACAAAIACGVLLATNATCKELQLDLPNATHCWHHEAWLRKSGQIPFMVDTQNFTMAIKESCANTSNSDHDCNHVAHLFGNLAQPGGIQAWCEQGYRTKFDAKVTQSGRRRLGGWEDAGCAGAVAGGVASCVVEGLFTFGIACAGGALGAVGACGPAVKDHQSSPPPPPHIYPRSYSLCSNTCSTHNDYECDDGGYGSEYGICSLNTDCADCTPSWDSDRQTQYASPPPVYYDYSYSTSGASPSPASAMPLVTLFLVSFALGNVCWP